MPRTARNLFAPLTVAPAVVAAAPPAVRAAADTARRLGAEAVAAAEAARTAQDARWKAERGEAGTLLPSKAADLLAKALIAQRDAEAAAVAAERALADTVAAHRDEWAATAAATEADAWQRLDSAAREAQAAADHALAAATIGAWLATGSTDLARVYPPSVAVVDLAAVEPHRAATRRAAAEARARIDTETAANAAKDSRRLGVPL